MKLPEFNLFSEFNPNFLDFSWHSPEFPWFSQNWGGGSPPPLVSYAYDPPFTDHVYSHLASFTDHAVKSETFLSRARQ